MDRCESAFRSPTCVRASSQRREFSWRCSNASPPQGQWVHTSLLQGDGVHDGFPGRAVHDRCEVPAQAGNFHPTSIPTGVYKARDGYLNIAVFGSKIWERFCQILGAPEWITDERYHDKTARFQHRDSLNAEINHRLAAHDRSYWIGSFNDGGVACGLISDMRESLCGSADPAPRSGQGGRVGASWPATPRRPADASGSNAQQHRPCRATPRRTLRGFMRASRRLRPSLEQDSPGVRRGVARHGRCCWAFEPDASAGRRGVAAKTRRHDLLDQTEVLDLRIRKDFAHVADQAAGHAAVVELPDPVAAVVRVEAVVDLGIEAKSPVVGARRLSW